VYAGATFGTVVGHGMFLGVLVSDYFLEADLPAFLRMISFTKRIPFPL
jgi:hypothetical protein